MDPNERRERSPPDEGALEGVDRAALDDDARRVEEDLTPEEHTATLTEMRRRIERGEDEDAAWAGAVRDVTERRVPVAREAEEGARRGAKPVEARERAERGEPGAVADERAE